MMLEISLVNFFLHHPPSDKPFAYIPLGILYLAGTLEREGRAFEVLDFQLETDPSPYDAEVIASFLDRAGSDLIGIGTMSNMLPFLVLGIRRLRARRPNVTIVLGGSGTSGLAEHVMANYPEIDAVVSGEAEEIMVSLLDAHQGRRGWEGIPGVSARLADGRTVHTARASRIADIDGLARPAYHRLPMEVYREMPLLTARGCPYRCTFCDIAPNWDRRVGRRSVDDVLSEVVALQERYPGRVFSILDDVFTLGHARVKQFCETTIDRGIHFEWACSCRVDLLDRQLLDLMHSAGCRRVFLGIESGSREVRRAAGKGLTIENVEEMIALVREYFAVQCSFIVGFPFETLSQFEETLMLALYATSLGCGTQLTVLSPLPQAELTYAGEHALAFEPSVVSAMALPRVATNRERFQREVLRPEVVALIRSDSTMFSAFYHFVDGRVQEKLARAAVFGVC